MHLFIVNGALGFCSGICDCQSTRDMSPHQDLLLVGEIHAGAYKNNTQGLTKIYPEEQNIANITPPECF